jgi:ribosomal protein S18 acetylase RimI-like enzyme
VPASPPIREISRADFLADLRSLADIYSAAMLARSAELPGRLSIMERHAGYPAFRALIASGGPDASPVAFAYGFHGEAGQWWHDVVLSAITAATGYAAARGWLDDPMEIAEVHVHPDYQGLGIGRSLLLSLIAGRAERTALLSTQDTESVARRLYRGLGFTDLLTGFSFPGGGPRYAVMGAALPLPDRGAG